MDQARQRQLDFNASSRDQWQTFADHRLQVSRLLGAGSGSGAERLCILGAGNALDLDLPALLEAHRAVHLVDLDANALRLGAERQGVAADARLRQFGGQDVTAMLDVTSRWTPGTIISPADLAALTDAPSLVVPPALAGPYDVVASTCLLRPLIGTLYHAVGADHPRFGQLISAVRAGHLRLMSRLLAPGGLAHLVTDVVSSATVPQLESQPASVLPELLGELERTGNHFHGVSPADLRGVFVRDPVLSAESADPIAVPPWRWRLHDRTYLVWALQFRHRDARLLIDVGRVSE